MQDTPISAVIVTRGDVDLTEILPTIHDAGITDIVIWNNQLENDMGVYGRYAALDQARNDLVYVQDDDCLIDVARLVRVADRYDLDRTIVANMPASRWPEYPDSCLVGWGALFRRQLPQQAFARYRPLLDSRLFQRTCDVVFTTLTPHVKIDIGVVHLPCAYAENRMWSSDPHKHNRERAAVLEEARKVRGAHQPA
jgi:hypothetical protein